eukprot:GHVU01064188.1.p1 GENE.GHVU01064188.1~~GHVU01064188.1.p1  ORF type:complete len:198 (+),score=21.04 GHVU01064188.1:43-594(+)
MSSEMTSNVASNVAKIATRINEAVGVVLSLRSEANELSSRVADLKKEENEARERIAALKVEEEQISLRISETNAESVRKQSALDADVHKTAAELYELKHESTLLKESHNRALLLEEKRRTNAAAAAKLMYVQDRCRVDIARNVLRVGLCSGCKIALDGEVEERMKELETCEKMLESTRKNVDG